MSKRVTVFRVAGPVWFSVTSGCSREKSRWTLPGIASCRFKADVGHSFVEKTAAEVIRRNVNGVIEPFIQKRIPADAAAANSRRNAAHSIEGAGAFLYGHLT